ncbi:CBS domain-containing protein [Pseudonocardia sp.]|uniref:CBS domain-containing protein n=1 Tax=Pseudonocardia sp. TaxID=60912 RepID=UPI00261E7413|nr:CBS domain-containing protein [Pseudonocardia sp.]
MRIADILTYKGRTVHTVFPYSDVEAAVHALHGAGVGALLVCDDDGKICGIVSERDIVRALVTRGSQLLRTSVADIMTRNVATCGPDDSLTHAMAQMTRDRFRHLPVLDKGELVGLVSIGDLVKHRLREMELQTGVLRDLVIAKS